MGTNSSEVKHYADDFILTSTVGIPMIGIVELITILKKFLQDSTNFIRTARYKINQNKEELDKIRNIFDGSELPSNGMFYFPYANKKAREILDKAGVIYTLGSKCGNKSRIRLSLANNNVITHDAVKQIKRVDRHG
jgi:hypothetical protein